MNMWLASKNLLIQAALTAAVVLLIWGLLALGVEQWLVPDPGTVAEELVQSFGAKRFAGVTGQLHSDLREQVSEAELRALAEQMEQAHQGISTVEAVEQRQEGETASVTLAVQFEDQTQQTINLPLAKQNYLWQVTGLDGLRALAAP